MYFSGRLLLVAAFLCEYLVVDEAELRAAWETIRLLKSHYPGRSICLEGTCLESFNDCKKEIGQMTTLS